MVSPVSWQAVLASQSRRETGLLLEAGMCWELCVAAGYGDKEGDMA